MRESVDNLALALVHYPVYNKHHQIVTTAVTNLDIHDIARSSKTYGLDHFFIVTPSVSQQELAHKITGHWQHGWGSSYNPDRKQALGTICVVDTVFEARTRFQELFLTPVKVVVTAAKARPGGISIKDFKILLNDTTTPYLLLFGTGWGLSDECFEQADLILDPIQGAGTYNHLSVRSAVAILLDRLKGK